MEARGSAQLLRMGWFRPVRGTSPPARRSAPRVGRSRARQAAGIPHARQSARLGRRRPGQQGPVRVRIRERVTGQAMALPRARGLRSAYHAPHPLGIVRQDTPAVGRDGASGGALVASPSPRHDEPGVHAIAPGGRSSGSAESQSARPTSPADQQGRRRPAGAAAAPAPVGWMIGAADAAERADAVQRC
jgi:hypothetical protein